MWLLRGLFAVDFHAVKKRVRGFINNPIGVFVLRF